MAIKRREVQKEIDILINKTAESIVQGEFAQAHKYLDRAFSLDFVHQRVIAGLMYIKFWEARMLSLSENLEPIEHAEVLLQYWKSFKEFLNDNPNDLQLIQSFRLNIFTRVHNIFSNLEYNKDEQEMQLWQGIAYKGMGNYDDAQRCLSQAMQNGVPRARIFSELADTCALIGEEQKARVFFREAFFLDPQDVDIDGFESELFVRLVKKVREYFNFKPDELQEWLPVYGALWGLLNVKRELRALEYGKLRQRIFNYEQDLRKSERSPAILPRLLNHYFWLIDYFVINQEQQYKIDEILLKIRSVAPEIYKLYTN